MTTPPDFLAFFAGPFADALRAVEIPGMETASWDRRAAWLLWKATDEGRAFVPPSSEKTTNTATQPQAEDDIFG